MKPAGDEPSLRRSASQGVFWLAVQTWGNQALSLAVLVILARLLRPSDFGVVALAAVFMAFVQIFADQGFADAIVQRTRLDPEHLDTAFWTAIALGMVLMLVVMALADAFASAFDNSRLAAVLRVLALAFPIGALAGVQQAQLRRRLLFKRLALRSLVGTVAGAVTAVVFAFLGFGVWSLVSQQLVGSAVGTIVLWGVSDWRPSMRFSLARFRELWSFGINIVGSNFLNFFNRRSDDLLIGYFLGPVALGYYSVGYRMLLALTQVSTSTISQVAFPTFSRLQTDEARLRNAFYTATQLTSLVTFPIFIGMSILAPELIRVAFGARWEQSIPVLQILAFIGILHSVFFFNRAVIVGIGRPGWALGLVAVNAVGNVAAFAIAVHWGIVAVAAAYVIRGYLFSPLPLFVVNRAIGIKFSTYLGRYWPPLAGSAMMAAAMLAVKGITASDDIALAGSTVAGAVAYLVTVRVLFPRVFAYAREMAGMALPQLRWRT